MLKKLTSKVDLYYNIKSIYETKWSISSFKKFLSDENSIFLTCKSKPLGYLMGRVIEDDLEIISLIIKKKFRQKGLGSELINQLIKIALQKKINKIFLEVSVENYKAIALYKKYKFTKIGSRKKYYSYANKKTDADVMSLHLIY